MPFINSTHHPFDEFSIVQLRDNIRGVYGIFNYYHCLYIGKALDIKVRLLEHFRGTSDQSSRIWRQQPIYFVFQEMGNWDLDDLERSLIQEYNPICNQTD